MRLPRMTVRRLMVIVALSSAVLAVAPEGLRTIRRNTRGHAPRWAVPAARARVLRLKPGMTRAEVWGALGPYWWLLDGGMGGGPLRRHGMSYWLRPGCGLLLVFDHTTRPPRLVDARLQGNGW